MSRQPWLATFFIKKVERSKENDCELPQCNRISAVIAATRRFPSSEKPQSLPNEQREVTSDQKSSQQRLFLKQQFYFAYNVSQTNPNFYHRCDVLSPVVDDCPYTKKLQSLVKELRTGCTKLEEPTTKEIFVSDCFTSHMICHKPMILSTALQCSSTRDSW